MRLLALAYGCECGTRPNWRIFPAEREYYMDRDPDAPVSTWRCTGCGEIHVLPVKAYQDAKSKSEAA